MLTDVDDAQKLQLSPSSVPVQVASAMNNGNGNDPSANRHSTELLFEAPRTPHDHRKSLENVHDVEGDPLSGEEWVLHEQDQVKRPTTSVDENTNPASYSPSQAMSNSPPIVLKSLPTTPNPATNGHSTQEDDDEDASKLLISSLRTQLTDLHSQLEMLNSKLISSYSRISSLEDDLYLSNNNLDTTKARLKSLEEQRQGHIEALQSGVLVERAAIATELSRLMERATEEERMRGEEEGKRKEIERDLFELSAGLFGQANTMVAEERIARASAQRRVEECETQIFAQSKQVKELESTVHVLKEERNGFEREVGDLQVVIKAVSRNRRGARGLRAGRVPYKEYIAFVEHLRALVPSSPTPPAISTLITLPFLARLVTEDS
jgi:predicted  nucleic acid-binding Zn-ribbon protein